MNSNYSHSQKIFLIFTALSGLFSVAFGAFVSHTLATKLTITEMAWIQTGLQYQMFHTLALFALIFYLPTFTKYIGNIIGFCWLLGIICFSGSLYSLALTGFRPLVYMTPFGGILFIIGWLTLLIYVIYLPKHTK